MKTKITRHVTGFLYGAIFGLASPIPGVSAGSIAVLLNVYEGFFTAFGIDLLRRNKLYTLVFLLGWAAGLFGATVVLLALFAHYRMVIHFGFMGLVAGSLPHVYAKTKAAAVKPRHIAVLAASLSGMVYLAHFGESMTVNQTLAQMGGITPEVTARVFFLSFASSAAMLLPGVGGSLMMMVFGIHTVYLEAVRGLMPVLLAAFGVSMVLGVLAGIVLTKKVLTRWPQMLYFAVMGFILGSLFIIYPGLSHGQSVAQTAFALFLCAGCAVGAYGLGKGE
jgi:putative membrane protein